MTDYSYLFREFEDQVVNTNDAKDPVVQSINAIAEKNGLNVHFNKVGSDSGGATVQPFPNEVRIDLTKGTDNKWRVFI